MANCYIWRGSYGPNTYTFQACANNPGWIALAGYPGYFAPSENGVNIYGGWVSTADSITLVTSESQRLAAIASSNFAGGDCSSCLNNPPPVVKYDCINGVCTLSTIYKTPGFYESLTACESVCGTGTGCIEPNLCVDPETFCPPGKVCIPSSEWGQIESLSSQLRQRNCS